MIIKQLVGARIKELRKALKETQEALAFKADVDKTYWNEVENGKRNVSIINLYKIIGALEVSVSDFFKHKSFSGKASLGNSSKTLTSKSKRGRK